MREKAWKTTRHSRTDEEIAPENAIQQPQQNDAVHSFVLVSREPDYQGQRGQSQAMCHTRIDRSGQKYP
jgi:hypothetical protein